jgi:hypothetical protein
MPVRDDVEGIAAFVAPEAQSSKSFLLPRAGRLFFKKGALAFLQAAS